MKNRSNLPFFLIITIVLLFIFFSVKLLNANNEVCNLSFIVTVPDDTPKEDIVYITGNKDFLKNWDPKGVPFKRINENTYFLELEILVKNLNFFEYKFTRGSWDTIEVKSDFSSMPNRLTVILPQEKSKEVNINIEKWADQGKIEKKSTLNGNIVIYKDFYSNYLKNSRDILVYLPPGYETDKTKKYPVLYLNDGKNVFDAKTSFSGIEWGLDETAEKLIYDGKIKKIIMVAVNNNNDRINEYTYKKVPNEGGGNLDTYANFLINELKPFIDKNYQTITSPSETGIVGSSLGGLCALYLGYKHPETFNLIGVVSPSLWWANKDIIKIIEKEPKKPLKIWLDMGTNEEDEDKNNNNISDAIDDTRQLRDILINKGYNLNKDFFYYEDEGATHNEAAWSKRADKILLFLYGNDN